MIITVQDYFNKKIKVSDVSDGCPMVSDHHSLNIIIEPSKENRLIKLELK